MYVYFRCLMYVCMCVSMYVYYFICIHMFSFHLFVGVIEIIKEMKFTFSDDEIKI